MNKALKAITSIAVMAAATPVQSGDFINWKPLLKETVAGNAGLEAIIPRITLKDSNLDEVIDQVFVSFDVWAAGTRTLLFRTKQRGANLPALPCISPVSDDFDLSVKFTNETGGRSNIVILANLSCTEGTGEEIEAYKTIVYSADVTQSPAAGGTSWRQAWNADSISFNNLDWDNDANKEIILNLAFDSGDDTNVRTIIMQQSDGTIEADTTYRLVTVQ